MQHFLWTVVGAGPAGIAAVGKLLDHGIDGGSILWIDPQFNVGDFGALWQNIPSNTKVDLFLKFLHSSAAFSYANCEQSFEINHVPKDKTCYLRLMAEPLQWVSDNLQTKVLSKKDSVERIVFNTHGWNLKLENDVVISQNVILAIGAEPQELSFQSCKTLSLHDAMDEVRIKNHLVADDVVAVFGSSHSAVLALKNLAAANIKKVINFYRSPLLYAIYNENEILYDDTGLKGTAAEWARAHLQDNLPANFMRVYSDEENIQKYLPECTKAVYAVGFKPRAIAIDGIDTLQYCNKTGVLAPGLYGFGIAFPEVKVNSLGLTEYRVGLWKFMDYLQRVMPVWLRSAVIEAPITEPRL